MTDQQKGKCLSICLHLLPHLPEPRTKNQQSHPSPVISITNVVTIKLTVENYLLWKAQLVPYFCGQDLFGYLDGTIFMPPKIISFENNIIPNFAYNL